MDVLYRRSEEYAQVSAIHIAPLLDSGATILDVGGGHGRYSRAFAGEGLRPTLMDKSIIVDYARNRDGDALSYVAGDFFEDDLGGPYDAGFLSNIVHGIGGNDGAIYFSLTMLLFTEYGDSPELTQAADWLRHVGFAPLDDVGHLSRDINEDWQLLMARKSDDK